MNNRDNRPNLFIREIPLVVLLVFWVTYSGIEIIRGRLDILASVIPTALFIIAYIVVRMASKEGKGQG